MCEATKRQKMNGRKRKVLFANRNMEYDYRRFATSKHPEEKRLYSVLKQIRATLHHWYLTGKKIPENKIPSAYRRMFQIDNLWRLDLSGDRAVLYSLIGNEIWIIDMP